MAVPNFITSITERGLQKSMLDLALKKDKEYKIINIYQRKDGKFVCWYYETINEAIKQEIKEVQDVKTDQLN